MEILIKKDSTIHGKGIFTNREIQSGETFYIVPTDKICHYPKSKCAFVGNNVWIDDETVLNYVNHSCSPNASLDISNKQPKLVSLRRINKGEEITVDYNKTEKGGKRVPCTCGSKNCRGYFLRIE
jgi:hypothetical protein